MLFTGCAGDSPWQPQDVLFGLSRLILRPDRTCEELRADFHLDHLPIVNSPREVGMDYEEHWIPVDGDRVIRAWYLPTRLDRGLAVISCGNSADMRCYLFTARLLTRNGWTTVIYDYGGFGLSTGAPNLSALSRDLDTVLTWSLDYTGYEQATLVGLSLGTIPSVAAGVARPNEVNGVILDSPIAMQALVERFGFVIGGRTDWVLGPLDPSLLADKLIQNLTKPLLIFLHEQDLIATPDTVELLYNRAAGPKQLVRFNLSHMRGQFFDTDLYLYYLENFLTQVWSAPASAAALPISP